MICATEEVLQSETPVLVDFWAPWCGPCNQLAPTIDEIAREYDGQLKVGKLNVDENMSSAGKYGIRTIPAVLLFHRGEVVETLIGVQPKSRYARAIDGLEG